MTTVIIQKSQEHEYKGFLCIGHAMYNKKSLFHRKQFDYDIVCCAISTLVINTHNSLEKLSKDKVKVGNINKKDGFMQFVFEKPLSNKGKLLMDSLVLGLKQLEKQYGVKYIKLIFEEV